MEETPIVNSANEDTLELWADECFEEDVVTENVTNKNQDLLYQIKSRKFNSLLKTIFFKLTGLMIALLEGSIKEENFENTVIEYLKEYTLSDDLINRLAKQTYNIWREIKYIPNDNENYYNNNIRGGNLIQISNEDKCNSKKVVFFCDFEKHLLYNLIQVSDFGLVNRIELGLYAVMIELGFREFNKTIREKIEIIRQVMHQNLLPVYKSGIDLVINDTIYLTNRTYGLLYNKFYSKIIKSFVDKI